MACEVNFVVNHEQQHQTEEEKMEAMWLDLARAQTNYCLGLIIMAHVQTSRSASELDKVNLLSHLGPVMEDVRKGYDGFREICTNIRQAPFTVPLFPPPPPPPPGFQRSATNLPTYNCEIIKLVKSANNSTRQTQSGSVIWKAKYRNVKRRQKRP